jgi:fucose permease
MRLRRARIAVSTYFAVMGLASGVWMARIPAIKTQAHLSDGTLGAALFALPVGLFLGSFAAERLIDRVGSAPLVRICGIGIGPTITAPGAARNLAELVAAMLAYGLCFGMLDVSQNAQGVRVEAAYGRPVMTSMHAFYSLGAILGSLAGGGFALAGIGLLPSLAVAGITGLIVDGTAGFWLLPETPRPAGIVPDEPAASPAVATSIPATDVDRRHVRRLVLVLGVLGICGLICEGAAGDWSAVYLRDNLGTSAGLAAFGFAAFSVTMTLGRAVGDRLIHRFGVVTVIRFSGVIATAGIALAMVTPVPAVTIAGFTAFGAGLSIVVPQVFAAGGRADPERPGAGLARVVGLGYTGMAAGPAIIGLVANQIGLHLALVILVVLAAWIAVAASALGEPRNRPGKPISPIAHQKAAGIP